MNENEKKYKTIGEVAKLLNLVNKKTGKLSTHTLRFWEKEFKEIKPYIFAGNRRYYDEKLIKTLKIIQFLLKIVDSFILCQQIVQEKNIFQWLHHSH